MGKSKERKNTGVVYQDLVVMKITDCSGVGGVCVSQMVASIAEEDIDIVVTNDDEDPDQAAHAAAMVPSSDVREALLQVVPPFPFLAPTRIKSPIGTEHNERTNDKKNREGTPAVPR